MTLRFARFATAVCLGILSLLAIALIGCSSAGGGHTLFGAPAGPIPKFAYVANPGDNNVSAYTIDATSGALTPVAGSPFGAGIAPFGVAVDRSGKFLYVTNAASNNVSAFTINATSGALTPVAGSPFATGTFPSGVAVDPSGRFLYVVNILSNNVSAYTINATTGALTPVAGSPFATGGGLNAGPNALAIDPSGKFAYVANNGGDGVSAYTINTTSGALTPVAGSPFAGFAGPAGVTVDPSGRFVYVANAANITSGSVSALTIDGSSGALTPVAGSPFATGGGGSRGVAVEPAGKFVYVSNERSSTVSAFTINSTSGALMPVAGSPFASTLPSPFGADQVAVDPSGKFAYVTNSSSNNVSAYTINPSTGALTLVPGSPFVAGSFPFGVAVARQQ